MKVKGQPAAGCSSEALQYNSDNAWKKQRCTERKEVDR